MEPKEKIQNHGMTSQEIEDLRYKQIHGEVEFVDANNAGDNIQDLYFKQDYGNHKIPVYEKHIYHVAAEPRTFAVSGAVPVRTSVSVVHKFTKEAWEFQKKQNIFNGQVVHILHNPELEEAKSKKERQAIQEQQVPGAVKLNEEADVKTASTPVANSESQQNLVGEQLASTGKPEQPEQPEQPGDLEELTVPELKEYYRELTGEAAPSNITKAELIKEIKRQQKHKK